MHFWNWLWGCFDNKVIYPNQTLRFPEMLRCWFWPRIQPQITSKKLIFTLFYTKIVSFTSKSTESHIVWDLIWCNTQSFLFIDNFLHQIYSHLWEISNSLCVARNWDTKVFGVPVTSEKFKIQWLSGAFGVEMKVTVMKHYLHMSEGAAYPLFKN